MTNNTNGRNLRLIGVYTLNHPLISPERITR